VPEQNTPSTLRSQSLSISLDPYVTNVLKKVHLNSCIHFPCTPFPESFCLAGRYQRVYRWANTAHTAMMTKEAIFSHPPSAVHAARMLHKLIPMAT